MFYDSFRYNNDITSSIMEDTSLAPSMYEDFSEGAMVAIAESETNYTKLMMAIGITEAINYSETGSAMVYTENFISNIISKITAFFRKIMEKVKALFKKFVLIFDQYTKNNQDFLNKYESRISNASNENLSFKGYRFSNAACLNTTAFNKSSLKTTISQYISSFKSDIDDTSGRLDGSELSEKKDQILNKIRGFLLGYSNREIDDSEFSEKLFEHFHGSASKQILQGSDQELNLTECIACIKNSKEVISNAQKSLKSIDDYIEQVVDDIESEMKTNNNNYQDDSSDGDNKKLSKTDKQRNNTKYTNVKIDIYRNTAHIMTQTYGAYLSGLKDRTRQARAICTKAIIKPSKINEESAGSAYFGTGDFLNSVVFK